MSFVAEEVSAPDDTGQGIDHRHFKVMFRREQVNCDHRKLFPFSPKQIKWSQGLGASGGVHTLASQVHQVPRDAVLQTSLCPDL